MPFTITAKQIMEPDFRPAISKLNQASNWEDPKVAYNVSKIVRYLSAEYKTIGKLIQDVWTESCVKDEKGQWIPEEAPTPLMPWKVKEGHKESALKKLDEIEKMEFTVERYQIPLDALHNANLTPSDYTVLEPLIAD